MGVDLPVVELVVVGDVGIACVCSQVADFLITLLEGSCQLVDVHVGHSKLLGGNGSTALHDGHEAIDDGAGNVTEFVPSEVDEGLGGPRGEWGMWSHSSRLVGVYMEWRWCDFLYQLSGGVRDILDGGGR